MSKCDVVVIGAGAAGLTAGALLAAEGKSVQVLERSQHLGGRALAVEDEGVTGTLGGHQHQVEVRGVRQESASILTNSMDDVVQRGFGKPGRFGTLRGGLLPTW